MTSSPGRPIAIYRAAPSLAPGSDTRPPKSISRRLDNIRRYKQARRSAEYMRALVVERAGPDVVFVEAATIPSREQLGESGKVFLLWDDAIGAGWGLADLKVMLRAPRSATVTVLNGRRRSFALTPMSLAGTWARRFFEATFLGELAFTIVFMVVSPFIVGLDLVRGRR